MPLDYQKIKNWRFQPRTRTYTREDLVCYARGFGAGLPGPLQEADARYISPGEVDALPMAAVTLADGEFWQQDPSAGLDWKQIVHAEEAITVHRPLPVAGSVTVNRRIVEIYDRGAEKGAMVLEQMQLTDPDGLALVTIDVTTVLRADGGFGGSQDAPRARLVPADRPPELTIELATPPVSVPVFQISSEFAVAAGVTAAAPSQRMLRGVCAFGLAGRAVLKLLCGNDPKRLRRLMVRYAGPMMTDETMRLDFWHTAASEAAFRMHAVERIAPVLMHCHVQYDP